MEQSSKGAGAKLLLKLAGTVALCAGVIGVGYVGIFIWAHSDASHERLPEFSPLPKFGEADKVQADT